MSAYFYEVSHLSLVDENIDSKMQEHTCRIPFYFHSYSMTLFFFLFCQNQVHG